MSDLWKIPVTAPYRITSDAQDHLDRSDLCGIDFISCDPSKNIVTSISDGPVVYIHNYYAGLDPYNYDTLGAFFVIAHVADGFQVWARYCHNGKVTETTRAMLLAGDPVAEYGNTGMSQGAHLHVDFWIRQTDTDKARAIGIRPCTKVVKPWPGSETLLNVDATKFLTHEGLDVTRSRG